MNDKPFKAWGNTYDFTHKPIAGLGEQTLYDMEDRDKTIIMTPNPIDQRIYFLYSGDNVEEMIYEATYGDFMMLLTLVLTKDDIDSLCVGDVFYRSGKDHYLLIIDRIPGIPVLQFEGVRTRIALLKVWLGLVRAHQGFSLPFQNILVTEGLRDWNLDHDENDIVLEGLYHFGVGIYVQNLLYPQSPQGFSNHLYDLNTTRLKAIAYGMSALGKSGKILVYEDGKTDSIYPYNPNLRKWTPNPKEATWESIE